MTTEEHRTSRRRAGSETRRAAVAVALRLFSEHGYEATSMRRIAEELGVSKPALYYHFANKEDIVRSVMAERGDEATELASWARTREPGDALLRATVARWVGSLSLEKLRGIRFMNANPLLARTLAVHGGMAVGRALDDAATLAAGLGASPERLLLTRMALLALNDAARAADGTDLDDEQVLAAARVAAEALVERAVST